jgi:hypothetical protein
LPSLNLSHNAKLVLGLILSGGLVSSLLAGIFFVSPELKRHFSASLRSRPGAWNKETVILVLAVLAASTALCVAWALFIDGSMHLLG